MRAPVSGERLAIELHSPVVEHLAGYIAENRRTRPLMVAAADTFRGRTLALCGAGPSLRDADLSGYDAVFACNSAAPYLAARGTRVTAAVGIDQTPGMLADWAEPPEALHYLASSVSPALVAHIQAHGREVAFFHSFVGVPGEIEAYRRWPSTLMVTVGHSVVTRALFLAHWLGFERIDVFGADCALGPDDVAHANGTPARVAYRNPLILEGEVDGRVWRTRPDMLMTAVELVRLARTSADRVRLRGDTLPVALLDKPDDYLTQVCRTLAPGEPVPDAA